LATVVFQKLRFAFAHQDHGASDSADVKRHVVEVKDQHWGV